jgi:2-iminobutanoate/2-iminopropanoate deaminase
VTTDKIAAPAGPLSPAVVSGDHLFVSGQVGQHPRTGTLVDGGIAEQAKQAFANLTAIVAAAGKSLDDIVRVAVYLTDIAAFPIVNDVYMLVFQAPYPARTTIGVAALPLGALIEIDAIVG